MSNYSKDEAIKELQKKLEIEKAKFDKFVEDFKGELRLLDKEHFNFTNISNILGKLSSKEGKA
jgi:uncharacterized protein YeaO (DUF488 family)